MLEKPIDGVHEIPGILKKALRHAVDNGLCSAGKEVVVLSSTFVASKGEWCAWCALVCLCLYESLRVCVLGDAHARTCISGFLMRGPMVSHRADYRALGNRDIAQRVELKKGNRGPACSQPWASSCACVCACVRACVLYPWNSGVGRIQSNPVTTQHARGVRARACPLVSCHTSCFVHQYALHTCPCKNLTRAHRHAVSPRSSLRVRAPAAP